MGWSDVSGYARRRARERVLRGATQCAMPNCLYPGMPLNPDDKIYGSRRSGGWKPGPTYPSVDHVIPVALLDGWSEFEREQALHDPRYLRPAHLACNQSRGKRPLRRSAVEQPSRDWGV